MQVLRARQTVLFISTAVNWGIEWKTSYPKLATQEAEKRLGIQVNDLHTSGRDFSRPKDSAEAMGAIKERLYDHIL